MWWPNGQLEWLDRLSCEAEEWIEQEAVDDGRSSGLALRLRHGAEVAMDLEVERRFFELFVQKHRRERFLERLGRPKKRERIWADFRDTRYLDPRCLTELQGRDKFVEPIGERLGRLGMGQRVYAMSSDEDLDGREMPLGEVLRSLWVTAEILGFCRKSEVGFFKNHEDDFYILRKPSS